MGAFKAYDIRGIFGKDFLIFFNAITLLLVVMFASAAIRCLML